MASKSIPRAIETLQVVINATNRTVVQHSDEKGTATGIHKSRDGF
jgi:hypothetical protein